MKTKLTILGMLFMIIVSCDRKPQSCIEERFNKYIVSEGISNDFLSIDSIVLIDSVSLNTHVEQLMTYNDSVKAELFKAFEVMSNNLDKVPRSDAITYMELLSRFNSLTNRNIDKDIKEKLSIFLEDIPNHKDWYCSYKIFAKFKDKQKEFYVYNIAFEDTITVSSEKFVRTRKFDRFTDYCIDYMVNVSAPKSLLLDKVKEFANDRGILLTK